LINKINFVIEQEPQLSVGLKLARADIVHNAPATGTL